MLVHYVEVRSIAATTEEPDLVEEAMRAFLPEGTEVQVQEAEGHHGNPISILSARFENADEVRWLLDRLEPVLGLVEEELESRLDDDCNLWVRLKKGAALEGEVEPAIDDGIVVRFKLAAYPANRENARETAEELLA